MLKSANYVDAIKLFNKAILLKPDLIDAFNEKGRCLSRLFKYNEAIECYDISIKIDPYCLIAHNYKGYSLQSLNKQTESEYCFRKALLLNKFPNDAYTFYNKVKKQLIFMFLK